MSSNQETEEKKEKRDIKRAIEIFSFIKPYRWHFIAGAILLVLTSGLFMVLLVMGIRIASQARDKFGALMIVGVISYIFWHMFINIGMVIGILPIVGVPLPLLSYGGTGMLSTMVGLGLISSVAYRRYLF